MKTYFPATSLMFGKFCVQYKNSENMADKHSPTSLKPVTLTCGPEFIVGLEKFPRARAIRRFLSSPIRAGVGSLPRAH